MRVHIFQHVDFETPGFIESWLIQNGHKISFSYFFQEDYLLPELNDFDALIILGGPMSANDEDKYLWLKEEKLFIKESILHDKKIMGICLGSQILAESIGAKILSADHEEIGWYAVSPTEECTKIEWFYNLFKDNPVVFHWHGEKFAIPKNVCANLLSSTSNSNQAFLYNGNAIGLQFHLEVNEKTILMMLENCKKELTVAKYIQSEQMILEGISFSLQCNHIMSEILFNWLNKN